MARRPLQGEKGLIVMPEVDTSHVDVRDMAPDGLPAPPPPPNPGIAIKTPLDRLEEKIDTIQELAQNGHHVTSDHVERAITEHRREMDRLRGRLFGMVESWGRPKSQENGMKSLVRHLTYDAQADIEAILRGER